MRGPSEVVRRNTWYCRACHKKAYPSQSVALAVMGHVHHLNPHGRVPTRAYQCPYNPEGWHLTSQEERRTA